MRVMCTGRVDLAFLVRALLHGADGVIVGGCWPGECHYVTEGNYDALGNVELFRRLLTHVGVDQARTRIEWIAASEGARFAEVMSDFVQTVKDLGPLGARDEDRIELRRGLETVELLVPFLKLVEREKLRPPDRTEDAIRTFHAGGEMDRLFETLIADKLAVGRILSLLEESPLSTGEIADRLDLNPSDVSKHMGSSSRAGLVRYDESQKRYTLARAEGGGHG